MRKYKSENPANFQVGTIKISSDTKIPIQKVQDYCQSLVSANELSSANVENQFIVSINENGESSVIDKKYLKISREKISSAIKGFVLPLISIIGTIVIGLYTRHYNEKSSQLQKRLDSVEFKLGLIKNEITNLKSKIP